MLCSQAIATGVYNYTTGQLICMLYKNSHVKGYNILN